MEVVPVSGQDQGADPMTEPGEACRDGLSRRSLLALLLGLPQQLQNQPLTSWQGSWTRSFGTARTASG